MKFYHATTQEGWESIQEEGVLWGVREHGSRVTYLSTSLEDARPWAAIILEVEYSPGDRDNYVDGCWQCRVYEPIPLSAVTLFETNSTPHWTENELREETK